MQLVRVPIGHAVRISQQKLCLEEQRLVQPVNDNRVAQARARAHDEQHMQPLACVLVMSVTKIACYHSAVSGNVIQTPHPCQTASDICT